MKIKSHGEKKVKKLVLHRDTLRALDPSTLGVIAGGETGGGACETGRTVCWTYCASNCIC
ncbi:MAG: hypothetical protein ACLGI9_09855 [Thermoanaerobaculia bacterium]